VRSRSIVRQRVTRAALERDGAPAGGRPTRPVTSARRPETTFEPAAGDRDVARDGSGALDGGAGVIWTGGRARAARRR
jgi:hypothetical protein